MKTLKIYDPAMCCSTGVCGPSVDTSLVQLAADVSFLKSHGIQVERYNLGHQPSAFTANPLVLAEMGAEAEHLPIFMVDGEVKAKGTYPNREELSNWVGIELNADESKPRTSLKMASTPCCNSGDEGCC